MTLCDEFCTWSVGTTGPHPASHIEAVAQHTRLVLGDERLAVEGGVLGGGKEHTLVAPGLFILANAAGLRFCVRDGGDLGRAVGGHDDDGRGLAHLGLGRRGGGGGGGGHCRSWNGKFTVSASGRGANPRGSGSRRVGWGGRAAPAGAAWASMAARGVGVRARSRIVGAADGACRLFLARRRHRTGEMTSREPGGPPGGRPRWRGGGPRARLSCCSWRGGVGGQWGDVARGVAATSGNAALA